MKKIMFCGGGSAGHVIPNISIIEDLKGYEVCYAGTGGIEQSICDTHNIRFYKFEAVKFVRGKFFCNIAIPFKLLKNIRQAGAIIDKVKPDLVFCKGGYVCIPPAFAAQKRGIPVITHESDLTAGLANRIIARKCEKVLTSFPETAKDFKYGIYTGSPMRKSLINRDKAEAKKLFELDERPTLIVFGGGSGSKIINETLRQNIFALCKKYNVLHICGKGNLINSKVYGYRQIEFADDMGAVYACADAAVSRCGSNSAYELIALKIPTLFIPLGNSSSRGDQIKNAEYFKVRGLCKVLYENDLTAERLKNEIELLFSDNNLKAALAANSVKCGNESIIKEIKSVLQ